jgi:hypothetical protein
MKILRNHFYLELVLARPNNQNRVVGVRFMNQRYFLISVEPVAAAGWLVSTAAGAAAGGVAGGLCGALTQAEASSEDAYVYAEGVRRGGTLARAFRTPNRSRCELILDRSSVNVRDRGGAWRKAV